MLWDVFNVVILAATFMYTVLKAPNARVRRVAWLPLYAVVLEGMAAGLVDALTFWPLTALLFVARLSMTVGCVGYVNQSLRRARRAKRRPSNVVSIADRPVSVTSPSRCA